MPESITPKEKEVRSNAGRVVEAVRKFHNYSQVEFSKKFGITQGQISKIETGILAPDLYLWMQICQHLGVKDPYCFYYGSVELEGIPKLENVNREFYDDQGLKLPRGLKRDALITSRKIRPMIEIFRRELPDEWKVFLKKCKITDSMFDILNFPVPASVVRAIADFCGSRPAKLDFARVMDFSARGNHGLFLEDYQHSRSGTDLLKSFIKKQNLYARDFEYSFTSEGPDSDVVIGIRALPEFERIFSREEITNNCFVSFITRYPSFLMGLKGQKLTPHYQLQNESDGRIVDLCFKKVA